MAQKCKQNRIIKSYSIQGKSSTFAKRKAKLSTHRKKVKEYQLMLEILKEEKEEEKKEE